MSDNTDCNDSSDKANPGSSELCDGIDNNCDGNTDEDTADDAITWYADSDSDGYGDPNVSDVECYQPTGYVTDNSDCNDSDSHVHPDAAEICGDGNDYDCVVGMPFRVSTAKPLLSEYEVCACTVQPLRSGDAF